MLLCPWNFPGKDTGGGFYALLQGTFPNQGPNLSLLRWQAGSLPLSHQGNPSVKIPEVKNNFYFSRKLEVHPMTRFHVTFIFFQSSQ